MSLKLSVVFVLLSALMIISTSCDNKVVTKEYPKLILTAEGVEGIKSNLGTVPLFDNTLQSTITEVDAEISKVIEVPIPKDLAGGYTHERHKKNYMFMQKAGALFQITGDEKYAQYIRTMLLEYASMFPSLDRHPAKRSYTRGKLFWQCLNDANWLVYTSQAYDCIYEWLSPEDRQKLNDELFRPYADFISIETPHFFNRIHNHSTWACAGVGMIGLVMNDSVLVKRSLYGLEDDGIEGEKLDNDGAVIKTGEKAGFLAQIELLFSPDGYYAEGPYYQRYAIYPFLVFAVSLENTKPELGIFKYRDGLLGKAVNTLIKLTDDNGNFYSINDGQKGMSYYSGSVVAALDIVYHYVGQNPSLLSIAKLQNNVTLDNAGMSVAMGIRDQKEIPVDRKSVIFRDGAQGDEGGLAIIRAGQEDQKLDVVFKYSAQGMGHGHFDRLAISMLDAGNEVLQDYGMARFVNIEQKSGGGYLKENKTYAKQTVAHNALVVNQTSNFKGNSKVANDYHADAYFSNVADEKFQIVSAKEVNAYKDVALQRTIAVLQDDAFERPVIIDVMRSSSDKENDYDLSFHYLGQFLSANFEYSVPEVLKKLGEKQGYQHIYNEGEAVLEGDLAKMTWFANDKFYSISSALTAGDKVIFGRSGASDPEFNLRRDPLFIYRKEKIKSAVFASVIESHGQYSRASELGSNAFSSIEDVNVLFNDEAYTAIEILNNSKQKWVLLISNNDNQADTKHGLKVGDATYEWQGAYRLIKE